MKSEVAAARADTATSEGLAELAAPGALERPLCVRLDGALLTTHTTWEAVFRLLRSRPWALLWLPLWLLSSPARLSREIARRAPLDPAVLPYREPLLQALRTAAAAGRKLVLCGGANVQAATAVAERLNLFTEVWTAQDAAGCEPMARLDGAAHDFVGHTGRDLPHCGRATRGYLVGASPGSARRAERLSNVRVVSTRPSALRASLRVLRPHQWAKNALVFLPLMLSPSLPALSLVLRAALATATFSLVASSGYVLNDLLDLDADRAHATKRARPFASGALPIALGPPLFLMLIGVSFSVSVAWLPPLFTVMLAAYFVATVSYSLWLKQLLLVDVLVLAGLYSHRILAGGAATDIPISSWLLAFSLFFFLSLAFQKRYIELRAATGTAKLKSRGYGREDIDIVRPSGTAAGHMAVLVFALYIEDPDVRSSYAAPELLWAACPVLIYWIGRMWFLAHRGQVEDDPVKFALRDRMSWLCGLVVALIAGMARLGPALWG